MSVIDDQMFRVLITGKDNTGEWDIAKLREGFKFGVHGDDSQGRWDIVFPTMFDAMEFYRVWKSNIALFQLRSGDAVTDLDAAIVMTMTPYFKL